MRSSASSLLLIRTSPKSRYYQGIMGGDTKLAQCCGPSRPQVYVNALVAQVQVPDCY